MQNNRLTFMERLSERLTSVEAILKKLDPIESLLERIALLEKNMAVIYHPTLSRVGITYVYN